jgi:hypothetical protein
MRFNASAATSGIGHEGIIDQRGLKVGNLAMSSCSRFSPLFESRQSPVGMKSMRRDHARFEGRAHLAATRFNEIGR